MTPFELPTGKLAESFTGAGWGIRPCGAERGDEAMSRGGRLPANGHPRPTTRGGRLNSKLGKTVSSKRMQQLLDADRKEREMREARAL